MSSNPSDTGDAIDQATAETEDSLSVSPEDVAAAADVSAAAAAQSERDAYRDLLQRVQADFENYKKRVDKLESERTARAAENLVKKLLPVFDTLDLALEHEPSGSLEQIKSGLDEVLSKEGLERVGAVEDAFDPEEHEAVAHEPGEGEQRIAEVLRAGYRWKGRVIRPAMVKVTGS